MGQIGYAQQFNKIPVLGLVPEKNSTAPASPVDGQLWVDTSGARAVLKYYNSASSTWIAADYSSLPAGYITDAHINAAAAIQLSKLATNPLARANHTGTQLAATISDFDTQVRTSRLDQLTAPTASVSLNGQKITNLADPTLASDAANKNYVDNARAGLAGVKDPARVALVSNVNLAAPGATLDSTSLTIGDRFLAAGQTTATQNGLYVYNGASSAAVRAIDADGTGEVQDGTMVAVSDGTYAGYQFIQTATPSGAPGSWTQTWVVFQTGGQTYLAGNGLTLTGTTFALTAPVSVANGGTGATNATAARVSLGAVGKYAVTLGALAAGTPVTVTHNLNTTDIGTPAIRTLADGKRLELDWAVVDANSITVSADIAFAASAVRVVVVG